jgi:hypothetical protein
MVAGNFLLQTAKGILPTAGSSRGAVSAGEIAVNPAGLQPHQYW